MSDQLSMFELTTFGDIPSAISLQGSASGPTPCASQAGPTIEKSGPAPAPVNLSARLGKVKRSTTKGIFGQSSFASSKHENLSFALASRLRPLTDSLGSTLFNLTWMTRVTPAGRSISALRASEPLTEGNVCIGWPKPQSSDMSGGGQAKRSDGRANLNDFAMLAGWRSPTACSPNSLRGSGQEPAARELGGHAVNLQDQVRLVGWTTASATDGQRSGRGITEKMSGSSLTQQVQMSGWKTPCVPNGGRISGNKTDIGKHQDGTKAQIGLENEAKLTGWATPKVASGDWQYGNSERTLINLNLSGEAQLTAFGDQPIGYLLGLNGWEIVPASGQLNPSHSRWLMGLPRDWDVCGMKALRKSRKK